MIRAELERCDSDLHFCRFLEQICTCLLKHVCALEDVSPVRYRENEVEVRFSHRMAAFGQLELDFLHANHLFKVRTRKLPLGLTASFARGRGLWLRLLLFFRAVRNSLHGAAIHLPFRKRQLFCRSDSKEY